MGLRFSKKVRLKKYRWDGSLLELNIFPVLSRKSGCGLVWGKKIYSSVQLLSSANLETRVFPQSEWGDRNRVKKIEVPFWFPKTELWRKIALILFMIWKSTSHYFWCCMFHVSSSRDRRESNLIFNLKLTFHTAMPTVMLSLWKLSMKNFSTYFKTSTLPRINLRK